MTKPSFFDKIFLITAMLLGAFLTPVLAQTQSATEFWISTKATGNMYPNGGTLDSPLDGSTSANFDSNMGNLPPNCTIHILAGTYQTYGANGWWAKSGQKILGSGMDVTTLQLVHGAPSDDFVLNSYQGTSETNIEVSDLTCDCNYTYGAYTYHGIALEGPGMVVRRAKVIHEAFFDTSISNSESWGITLSGQGELIEDCEVSEFAGGVNNAISSITISGGSGIIRNNRVYLPGTGGAAVAFNGSFNNGILIQGNYVEGAATAVYNDTGGNTNIIIAHNIFENVRFGVLYFWNGNVRQNVNISDNVIMLTTNAPFGSGNGKWAVMLGNNSTNINIMGNSVGWAGEPNPGEIGFDYFLGVNEPGDQGTVVANNRVDSRLLNSSTGTNGISPGNGYTAHDNYDLSGNLLPNLSQTPPYTNSLYILPPDAFVQMWGAGSVTVGPQFMSLNGNGFYGWNCSSNASATILKTLPLPNDYWGGRTTFVTSWTIWTTNAGNYIFNIAISDLLTNAMSGFVQKTATLAAPAGTNVTTITVTNTLPAIDPAEIASLETMIWTAYQVQPGNYTILSGKVTAQ